MQEFIKIIEQFAFFADYTHLLLLGLLGLLALCFFILLRIFSSVRQQDGRTSSFNRELAATMQNRNTDLSSQWTHFANQCSQANADSKEALDKIAQEAQRTHGDVQELQQTLEKTAQEAGRTQADMQDLRQEVSALARALEDAHTAAAGEVTALRGLLEKNGIFLYDRFNELTGDLATRLEGQNERVENIRELLSRADTAKDIQGLRDGIAREIADLMLKERALQQEVQTQTISLIGESINRLAGEMDAKLTLVTDKVSNRFGENLASTMQSFAALQGQIDALIATRDEVSSLGGDVTSLARLILSQGGGGIAAGHLPDMLAAMLPDDAYVLNPVVNGRTAAAQLILPGEQGAVVVDSSLPMEDFEMIFAPDADDAARREARLLFGERVMAHINYVADNFIAPPATGANALLFVPSEIAFAELQAHHKDCASHAASRHVWLVSPTTLAAALNMARSALKDQKARLQLEQMKKALREVAREAQSFEARLLEIGDHVNNAMRSVQRAESAGVKLFGDVRSISDAAKDEGEPPALTQSAPSTPPAER